MTTLVERALADFVAFLRQEGIRRFFLVAEDGEVRLSHEALQPIADWLAADPRDFAGHEGFFVELGDSG